MVNSVLLSGWQKLVLLHIVIESIRLRTIKIGLLIPINLEEVTQF